MADDAKRISDAISASGQPTPEDLQQAAQDGFKSVLNLRNDTEAGVLADEQQKAEQAGLHYAQVPISPSEPDPTQTSKILEAIADLPKPLLIHCGAGARASALGLIATATEAGWNRSQTLAQINQLGLNPDQPQLKQFLADLPDA